MRGEPPVFCFVCTLLNRQRTWDRLYVLCQNDNVHGKSCMYFIKLTTFMG